MRFPAFFCYLTFLMATLVLVATSLRRSPSDPQDGIVNRGLPNVYVFFKLPRHCPKFGQKFNMILGVL